MVWLKIVLFAKTKEGLHNSDLIWQHELLHKFIIYHSLEICSALLLSLLFSSLLSNNDHYYQYLLYFFIIIIMIIIVLLYSHCI